MRYPLIFVIFLALALPVYSQPSSKPPGITCNAHAHCFDISFSSLINMPHEGPLGMGAQVDAIGKNVNG